MSFFVKNNVFQGTATPDTPVIADPVYESRGVFSINALKQLQGSLWIIKNGELVTSSLTTASYEVFDKSGVSVGISQTGITPNAQAQFIITAVNASSLMDLTHYLVKITIPFDGEDRIGYVGINLV